MALWETSIEERRTANYDYDSAYGCVENAEGELGGRLFSAYEDELIEKTYTSYSDYEPPAIPTPLETDQIEREVNDTVIAKEDLNYELQSLYTFNRGIKIGHETRINISKLERAKIDGEIIGRTEVITNLAERFGIDLRDLEEPNK